MDQPSPPSPPSTVLALTASGEPFRLLFPLGLLLGIAGVALWPIHALGWLERYPAISHPRIMIQGFMTAFVVGFLGTATPRMLGVRRFGLSQTLLLAGLIIAGSALHALGLTKTADLLFLLTLLSLISLMALRWRSRRDIPPPGFVLVAMGMLCALAGATIPALAGIVSWPAWAYSLWPLLLYQGYLLLPIMGIGAFLLPCFFNLPNLNDFPESLSMPPGWGRKAAVATACGIGMIASFGLEAAGFSRVGPGARAGLVLFYFWREVPVHQADFKQGTLALTLRLALFSIPTGYLLISLWPGLRMAWMHVVLITGFSLLVFTVASRVILGHSGQSQLFRATHRLVLAMAILFAAALLSRIAADFLPAHRISHYFYAALLWMSGAIIWGIALLPSVRRPDT